MKGKKSFILYCDMIATVEKLPDEAAGRLLKTILQYVNDRNPIIEDLLLQIAFEPIKQQLKRDLIDWEGERHTRSESGRLGGLRSGEARRSTASNNEAPLQKGSTASKKEANEAVTVNVTVTDNVNVNETHKQPVFEDIKNFFGFTSEMRDIKKWMEIRAFINSLISAGNFEIFKAQFSDYKKYKAESKEKIHSFPSFIDGGWGQENWNHKLKELKKSQASNGKTPPTDQVYIPANKPKGLSEDATAKLLREDRERLEKLAKEYKPGPEPPPSSGTFQRMKEQLNKLAPKT